MQLIDGHYVRSPHPAHARRAAFSPRAHLLPATPLATPCTPPHPQTHEPPHYPGPQTHTPGPPSRLAAAALLRREILPNRHQPPTADRQTGGHIPPDGSVRAPQPPTKAAAAAVKRPVKPAAAAAGGSGYAGTVSAVVGGRLAELGVCVEPGSSGDKWGCCGGEGHY